MASSCVNAQSNGTSTSINMTAGISSVMNVNASFAMSTSSRESSNSSRVNIVSPSTAIPAITSLQNTVLLTAFITPNTSMLVQSGSKSPLISNKMSSVFNLTIASSDKTNITDSSTTPPSQVTMTLKGTIINSSKMSKSVSSMVGSKSVYLPSNTSISPSRNLPLVMTTAATNSRIVENRQTLKTYITNSSVVVNMTSGVATKSILSDVFTKTISLPTADINKTSSSLRSETASQVFTNSSISRKFLTSTESISASVFKKSVVTTTASSPEIMTNTLVTAPVSNMTSSLISLPSSSERFSSAHVSSYQVTTPSPPVSIRITIDANCSQVPANTSEDFKNAVRTSFGKVLNIPDSKITISNVECGSIIVQMTIQRVSNMNIVQTLTVAVKNKNLTVTYNGTEFGVTAVEEITGKPTISMVTTTNVLPITVTSSSTGNPTVSTEVKNTMTSIMPNITTTSNTMNNSYGNIKSSSAIIPTVITSIQQNSLTSTFTSSTLNTSEASMTSRQNQTDSHVFPNSSMLSISSVSDTLSLIRTLLTNSSITMKATMLSSVPMRTTSVAKNMTTRILKSPIVNMTTMVRNHSYSPTTSLLLHPSSSQVTGYAVSIRVTIDAKCSQIPDYNSTSFQDEVRRSVGNALNISQSTITIFYIKCGSIIVDMTIENVRNDNIIPTLRVAVNKSQLNVRYNGSEFKVISVEKITTKPTESMMFTATITTMNDRSSSIRNVTMVSNIVSNTITSTPVLTTPPRLVNGSSGTMKTRMVNNMTVSTVATSPVVNVSSIGMNVSSSPTISSSLNPSSSLATTPFPSQTVSVRITIDANCTKEINNKSDDFNNAVRSSIRDFFNITGLTIEISAFNCGSVIVDLKIQHVSNVNITQTLMDAVNKKELYINYNGSQLAVTSVQAITTEPTVFTSSISRPLLPVRSSSVVNPTMTSNMVSTMNSTISNISTPSPSRTVNGSNGTMKITMIKNTTISIVPSTFVPSSIGVSQPLSISLQNRTLSQLFSNSSMLPLSSLSATVTSMKTRTMNSSINFKTLMLSSVVTRNTSIIKEMSTSLNTRMETSPVLNMTSTSFVPSSIGVSQALLTSLQNRTLSQLFTNSSMSPLRSLSATVSLMKTRTMNSSIISKTAMLSSVVQRNTSMIEEMRTSLITRMQTSPVVNMTSTAMNISHTRTESTLVLPSSTHVATTSSPQTVTVRITIDANCSEVVGYDSEDFKKAVRVSISNVLNIEESKITISNVKCGSIIVDMKIENVNNQNITKTLTEAVDKKQLKINYNGSQLPVTSVKTIKSKDDGQKDDDNTALIIYIVFGSILGLAFLIGIIALIVRCRRERSTGMFHLPSEENLELSGFTAQNKGYHGGNFYGELQPESGDSRINGFPNEADPISNNVVEDTENDKSFGSTGYLPSWKNLPDIDASQVSHEGDTNVANDNLLLTYGRAGSGEDVNGSSKTNFVSSHDNIGKV